MSYTIRSLIRREQVDVKSQAVEAAWSKLNPSEKAAIREAMVVMGLGDKGEVELAGKLGLYLVE